MTAKSKKRLTGSRPKHCEDAHNADHHDKDVADWYHRGGECNNDRSSRSESSKKSNDSKGSKKTKRADDFHVDRRDKRNSGNSNDAEVKDIE